MNKYSVELTGNDFDIRLFMAYLNLDEWLVLKENNSFKLSSNKFDNNNSIETVLTEINHFVHLMNGGLKILNSNYINIKTGNLIVETENNDKKIYGFLEGKSIGRSNALLKSELKNVKNSNINFWIQKAKKFPQIEDVLLFFNEITWINLYKIYELIRDDFGGEKQLIKQYHKKKVIKLFTQTAQSREAIGDKARHASSKYKASDQKLTIKEAHLIVKNLFEFWITTKY